MSRSRPTAQALPRGRSLLVAGSLALLIAAGCSSDSEPERAETITTTSTAPPADESTTVPDTELDEVLLTLDDMPPGYTLTGPGEESDNPVCNDQDVDDIVPNTDSANGDQFSAGPTGPFISSVAARYEDADLANEALDAFIDLLAQCDNMIELPSDQGPITLVLSPLSFNQVGDRTLALRGTSTEGPAPITADQVFAVVDDTLIGLVNITAFANTPDAALSEQLLTTMIDRAA